MRFRKTVSAEEYSLWLDRNGSANAMPWRGIGAARVKIGKLHSNQPPGETGEIQIDVVPTATGDSWMQLDLIDFNEFDFGECIETT